MMYQEHFQKELYSEILVGLKESFKDLKVEADLLIKSATEIYLSSRKDDQEHSAGITELSLVDKNHYTVTSYGVLECRACSRRIAKFIGDEICFCPGCGKAVREKQ